MVSVFSKKVRHFVRFKMRRNRLIKWNWSKQKHIKTPPSSWKLWSSREAVFYLFFFSTENRKKWQSCNGSKAIEKEEIPGTFFMLSCMSGCVGRAGPTSSRVSMAEPGVVAAVLTVVLGAVPEELTESISPATSWISRAKTAKSLARSWLILRTQGNNLLIRQGTLGLRAILHHNMHYQLLSTSGSVSSAAISTWLFLRCEPSSPWCTPLAPSCGVWCPRRRGPPSHPVVQSPLWSQVSSHGAGRGDGAGRGSELRASQSSGWSQTPLPRWSRTRAAGASTCCCWTLRWKRKRQPLVSSAFIRQIHNGFA